MKNNVFKALGITLFLLLTSCGKPTVTDSNSLTSEVTSTPSSTSSSYSVEETTSEESSKEENSSSTSSSESESSSFEQIIVNPNDPYISVAKEKTISQLVSLGKTSDSTNLYKITGVVQYISSPNYGTFDLIDSTGDILVYGCTASSSSITKSGSTYTFTNNKSFKNSGIQQGDTVTLIGLYSYFYYNSGSYGYPEFQGYVYSIDNRTNEKLEALNYDTSLITYNGDYYNGLTAMYGKLLGTQLHNLMDTTHKKYTSYSGLWSNYQYTGEYKGSSYKCFYSNTYNAKGSSNREHVWPQSKSNGLWGESYGGSDILHIRPAKSTYNSNRSNAPFGEIFGDNVKPRTIPYSGGGECRYATQVFEPADEIKGDVARIIMYVYVHYSTDFGGNKQSYYGDLSLGDVLAPYYDDQCYLILRKWNAMDPVSEQEKTLNDYAESVQGNRNPFIDFPSFADAIFGNM